MVIVIGPADPELVLPGFLHLPGPVPPLPIFALRCEEQIARPVPAKIRDRSVNQMLGMIEPVSFVLEQSSPSAKRLCMVQYRNRFVRSELGNAKSAIAMP